MCTKTFLNELVCLFKEYKMCSEAWLKPFFLVALLVYGALFFCVFIIMFRNRMYLFSVYYGEVFKSIISNEHFNPLQLTNRISIVTSSIYGANTSNVINVGASHPLNYTTTQWTVPRTEQSKITNNPELQS